MKRLMVDMDEVIHEGGFLHLINEYTGKNYKKNDFKNFYMQDILDDKDGFFDFFFEHNQYDYGYLMEDVVEVLKELSHKYEIFICSSYIYRDDVDKSGIILKHKHDFLRKNFPFINPYNYIFVGNKHVVKADILIDDRLDNLDGADRKLLFTNYHNESINDAVLKEKGVERVNDWKEIRNLLLND